MTCEHRTAAEAASWDLAGRLAGLARLASGGTVAGLDHAQRRILAVLDAGTPPGTRRCRYCRRGLFPVAGRWADGDGITVCMKYDGELPATEADYFYHEPDEGG